MASSLHASGHYWDGSDWRHHKLQAFHLTFAASVWAWGTPNYRLPFAIASWSSINPSTSTSLCIMSGAHMPMQIRYIKYMLDLLCHESRSRHQKAPQRVRTWSVKGGVNADISICISCKLNDENCSYSQPEKLMLRLPCTPALIWPEAKQTFIA